MDPTAVDDKYGNRVTMFHVTIVYLKFPGHWQASLSPKPPGSQQEQCLVEKIKINLDKILGAMSIVFST
jgi:hypothetical protein